MNISLIKTDEDYIAAMEKIDQILDAKEGSEESRELELLSILVEDYESKYYRIDAPNPIAAIIFRMEQLGLTRKDLEQYIGSRGRVSEILHCKRKLTIPMIRNLSKNLSIPVEVLIQEYQKKQSQKSSISHES